MISFLSRVGLISIFLSFCWIYPIKFDDAFKQHATFSVEQEISIGQAAKPHAMRELSTLGKNTAIRLATFQAAQNMWHQHQQEIGYYAQLTSEQIAQECAASIYQFQRAGQPRPNIEQYMLEKHHLYCIPAFVTCIKDFPSYRSHVKEVHKDLQREKGFGLLYRFNKKIGCLPPGFSQKVETFEKLHAEIRHEEFLESEAVGKEVRQLFVDYKAELPNLDSTRAVRIHKREQALTKDQSNQGLQTQQRYKLSDKATLLLETKRALNVFSDFTGTQLQHQLNQEAADLVNRAVELSTRRVAQQTAISSDTIIDLAISACELNRNGDIAKGYAIADLSWAMLDYSQAALEGAAEGLVSVGQDIRNHPIQAAATVIAAEGVLAYQLIKVLSEVVQVSARGMVNNVVMSFDPEKGVERWTEQLKPAMESIEALCKTQLSLRDGIKQTTKLLVHWKATDKVLGALSKFYDTTYNKAVAFVKKNPAATPEQYMATPDGMVFKAASDASHNWKVTRKSTDNTKLQALTKSTAMTKQEILTASIRLGFKKTNYYSHGQPVFQKGNKFITPDVDSHCGGFWKMANSVENLASKRTRMGTYDEFLNRIGD